MIDIHPLNLALSYLLLLIPLSVTLFYCQSLTRPILTSVLRMTVQLLFVGFYLQIVFKRDSLWLTGLWLMIMLVVADFSIVRGAGLKLGRFLPAMMVALLTGTTIPLLFATAVVLQRENWLEAQYAITIGGMILGNCLRANVLGIKTFYDGIRKDEKTYLYALGQGARLDEAVRPYIRQALEASLLPNIATMATIGLVSLPGMMTGVIMADPQPLVAIKYQIMIMLAIFSGTAATIIVGIWLTLPGSFSAAGVLDRGIFKVVDKKVKAQ